MNKQTKDILEVLSITRRAHSAGKTPRAALSAAIEEVSRMRGVRQQTIRAACSRGLRPNVKTMKDFEALVSSWLRGDPGLLFQALLPRLPSDERQKVAQLLDRADV